MLHKAYLNIKRKEKKSFSYSTLLRLRLFRPPLSAMGPLIESFGHGLHVVHDAQAVAVHVCAADHHLPEPPAPA